MFYSFKPRWTCETKPIDSGNIPSGFSGYLHSAAQFVTQHFLSTVSPHVEEDYTPRGTATHYVHELTKQQINLIGERESQPKHGDLFSDTFLM